MLSSPSYVNVIWPWGLICAGTVFAYGQSGSGKTYTMSGSKRTPGIISQAMNDIFDFIEKVSSASFPRLWMTSLTSLKRSVLDHFSGYEWYLWLHWKGQFWIISQAMNDIFDFIEKVSSLSFPRLWLYEWHLWLHSKNQFHIICQVLKYEWHLWLHWKGKFWIISQAMSDSFVFIETVNSASFPFR